MDIQTGVRAMNKAMKLLLWLTVLLGAAAHAGTVTYVYTDPQGTPLAEANASGAITATFDYAPYGSQAMGSPPSGPGYTGHVNDPDTGLVYMQARYYDPVVGRFISTDPVGPAVGNVFNFNRFGYANDNPIVNMDADGRCTGSLNQDGAGNCTDSGTSVASSGSGSGGEVLNKQHASQQPSGVKQVLIGLAKPVMNALNDIAAVMGDSEAARTNDLTPSNQNQAIGMMISGSIVGAVEAVATDGDSLEVNPEATAPVGRRGSPMDVPPRTNVPGTVEGIEYSGHAFDQMQGRGMTPSVVKNTIEHGVSTPGRNGATVHYDSINNTTVITNPSGRVITVFPGGS